MSSPLSTARLALEAASVAGKVIGQFAKGVQQSASFENVLAQSDSTPRSNDTRADDSDSISAGKLQSMIDTVANAIRSRLAESGIGANPPIEVGVNQNGQIRVTSHHDRAAEIETILQSEPQLISQLNRIAAVGGVDRIRVSNPR